MIPALPPIGLYRHDQHAPTRDSAGFTLVELMVAMVLGLLLIGGVISVFLGTQQASRTQEAMSRVQESGRLALEVISRDARQAGFRACQGGNLQDLVDPDGTGYDETVHDVNHAFVEPAITPLRGDVFAVHRMSRVGQFEANGSNVTNPINTDTSVPIQQGEITLVSDATGQNCEVFQNVPASPGVLNRNPNAGNVNPGNRLPPGATLTDFSGPQSLDVYRIETATYYVDAASTGGDVSSLYRASTANTSPGTTDVQEIVEGVHDMRVEYGRDTDDDQQVDDFTSADGVSTWSDTDWAEVAAIRIHLLVNNGPEPNVVDTGREDILFGDELVDAPDRRLYQVFTTTIAARNRTGPKP